MRNDGQAGLDYLAVVLVATTVLVAGTGVALARGEGIAASVRAQVVRALCIVSAGDCERDRAPCVTRSDQRTASAHATVLVVRVGKDLLALLEERSDGTVAVTLGSETDLGLEAGLGISGRGDLGTTTIELGTDFRAAALAHRGRGRTWILDSQDEALAFLRRGPSIDAQGLAVALLRKLLPEPDHEYREHGTSVTLGAIVAAGPGRRGSVSLSARDVDGERHDRRTGHRVLYLRRTQELRALAQVAISGRRRGSVSAEGGADFVWAVEVDARGRPVDLLLVESGRLHGSASLPAPLSQVAGLLGVPKARGARRYEVETHLDLTVPANLAVAAAFVDAVRDPRPRPFRARVGVAASLHGRLASHGTVHARTYALDETAHGGALAGALGARLGLGAGVATSRTRLLSAVTRGPDGAWRERRDCLDAVDTVRG